MIDLDELQRLALSATPGPWVADGLEGNLDSGDIRVAEVAMWREADAEFIAAVNPQAILELIERVRRAENARDGWASNAMEYANAITGAEVLLARIAEAAKLHRPVEGIHGWLVCSHRHCVDDSQDQCAWPCETAVALGMNEGSET